MPRLTLTEHLRAPGPKRVLALDGGGVRGALTLRYLARIESLLRERYDRPELVLSDYFDLIGGTSTGAIIAAGLAKGYEVRTLQELYLDLADQIFRRSWWRRGVVFPRYRHSKLRSFLDRHFGDLTLGDARLRTGLAIVTKRWDTGSPWVLHNNPRGVYYGADRSCEDSEVPNRCYNLAQVVRASTAAPTFFQPEMITIGKGVTGRFVDGGVTPHNNPALQLLLVATLEAFGFGWSPGADRLLLISVGTGAKSRRLKRTVREWLASKLAVYDGVTSLAALMEDCDALNQIVLHALSDSASLWDIDSEIGDLAGEQLPEAALLTFRRYNVLLKPGWLQKQLGVTYSDDEAAELAKMDVAANVEGLAEIGDAAANRQVDPTHFPPGFDLGVGQLPD